MEQAKYVKALICDSNCSIGEEVGMPRILVQGPQAFVKELAERMAYGEVDIPAGDGVVILYDDDVVDYGDWVSAVKPGTFEYKQSVLDIFTGQPEF